MGKHLLNFFSREGGFAGSCIRSRIEGCVGNGAGNGVGGKCVENRLGHGDGYISKSGVGSEVRAHGEAVEQVGYVGDG